MEIRRWHEEDEWLRAAYFVLVILRFIWPCFLQNGYLYPDEFFQSSEIMARDIFQINSTVTWEWNKEFPVRSPVSAFLTSGIPFLFMKILSKYINLSPYLLLIFPRIFMTLFSLLSFDFPLYIISRRLKLKPFYSLFVLATSYVTNVFATRPFSNTLETGIFGILLALFINPDYNSPSDSSKNVGKANHLTKYKCILIGSLTSLGFFCRQTFLLFALVPYLAYFICEMKSQKQHLLQIMAKVMFMAFGFFITSVGFITLDSWYFGHLQHGKIVLTSWNFIKYNSLQSHTHGHHPFFIHFLVNMPLLFGPMAFLFYTKLGSLLCKFCGLSQIETDNQLKAKNHLKYNSFLILCILVPVLILSLIPHQEPRFIMPVILPLVLLFCSKVVGSNYFPTIMMSWFIWNIIGCIFFGVLHQAGIVPSMLHLQRVINNNVQSLQEPYCHHVVYFHTYMPPGHLLAWPINVSIDGHKLFIHDLAGSSIEIFDQQMSQLKSSYCAKNRNMVRIYMYDKV